MQSHKKIFLSLLIFISISIKSVSYIPELAKQNSNVNCNPLFSINQLLDIDPAIRDYIIKNLLEDKNSTALIKKIKLIGDKRLIKYIDKFFESYKELYGNKEYGIPSVLAWKWFNLKNIFISTSTRISTAAISHDHSFIIICSSLANQIWNIKTGKLIQTLNGPTGLIDLVAISPDDSFVVTECGKTAKIWDSKTGELIHTLIGHTNNIISIVISHDNSFIVTGSDDNTAKIWNSKTGTLVNTLVDHTHNILSTAISSDNSFIVTGSMDKTAKIWNSKTGKLIHTLKNPFTAIKAVAISHDNSFIVTGSCVYINIWNSKTGDLIHTLEGNFDLINSVEISDDDSFIVITYRDGTIQIWDSKSAELIKTLISHAIISTRISHNSYITILNSDGIKIWSLKNKEDSLIDKSICDSKKDGQKNTDKLDLYKPYNNNRDFSSVVNFPPKQNKIQSYCFKLIGSMGIISSLAIIYKFKIIKSAAIAGCGFLAYKLFTYMQRNKNNYESQDS